MKKAIISLVLLLSTILAAPTITFPDGGYDTDGTYTITWSDTGSCYRLQERLDDGTYAGYKYRDTGTSFLITAQSEGKYWYRVSESSDSNCATAEYGSPSTEKSITVDKTSPTAASPSDGGSVATDADVDFQFSETMQATTPSVQFTPSVSGSGSWISTTLYRYDPSALTKGEFYTVVISGAQDLAGNTQDQYTATFTVDPDLESVTITAPTISSVVDQGSTITITASTTGSSGTTISDATVSTSGACITTLSHTSGGVYSGSCQVNTVGSNTLTVTATRASITEMDSVLFTVEKAYTLNMTVNSPTQTQFARGSTIAFNLKPYQPDNQVVTGLGVTGTIAGKTLVFTKSGDDFIADYVTALNEKSVISAIITASGSIAGKQKSVIRSFSITMTSAQINPNVELSPYREIYNPGEIVRLKADPKYADGTRLTTTTVTGSMQEQTVTFQKQPDGTYLSNETYIILASDSVVQTHVNIADQHGNSRGLDTDFEVAGGIFTVTINKPANRAIALGQSVQIEVRILKEGLALSGATVSLLEQGALVNLFEDRGSGVYAVSYSNQHETGEFSLRIKVSQGGQETSKVINFAVNNQLTVAAPPEIAGPFEIALTYANGDPVTEGTYKATIDETETTLSHTGDGIYTATLLVGEGTKTLSLSGDDGRGNQLSFSGPVEVRQSPQELALYGIAAVVLMAIIGAGYFIHHQAFAGPKKQYLSLLEQLAGTRETMMKSEQDFYKRRVSEDQYRKLQLGYQQEADSLRRKIVEVEGRTPKVKGSKYGFALQKAKEFASQNMSEGQISKILKDIDDNTLRKVFENYKRQAVKQMKADDAQVIQAVKQQLKSGVSESKIRDYLSDRFPQDVVERIIRQAKK